MRTRIMAVLAVMALLLLAGCGNGLTDLGRDPRADDTTAPTTSSPTTSAPTTTCSNATASYSPMSSLPAANRMPSGSTMARIQRRGYLIAGVSADTWLMGARNPLNGLVEGFDIDIVHAISKAIFNNPDKIKLAVITSDQRIPMLQNGSVDIVVRAFSMTCDRWKQIAFSTEYYQAGQKVLVPSSSGATSLADLAGKRVCAPAGTTSLSTLEKYPKIKAVSASTHTQCLALFQQGQVDAITGDDTVLAGLAAQDPYAKIVGKALTVEPYGVGIAAKNVDLVRFVNAILAQRVSNGTWLRSYDRWLAAALGPSKGAPTPVYGRAS